ncbi:MAG: hypothetical protein LBS36_03340 [Oscillospiraceae bacterium]|jgi:hypothetical protein|nr:hypothetical protein [Oscillospiraceae bacterium]
MEYEKRFVEVLAYFDEDGRIYPKKLKWKDYKSKDPAERAEEHPDETIFVIGKILDVQPRASLKAGGQGLRYSCIIDGKEKHLFLEDNRWFVEAKIQP